MDEQQSLINEIKAEELDESDELEALIADLKAEDVLLVLQDDLNEPEHLDAELQQAEDLEQLDGEAVDSLEAMDVEHVQPAEVCEAATDDAMSVHSETLLAEHAASLMPCDDEGAAAEETIVVCDDSLLAEFVEVETQVQGVETQVQQHLDAQALIDVDEADCFMDGLGALDGEILVMMKRGDISKDDNLAAMNEENRQIGTALSFL